jgi:aspartate aminotransferase/aminotransferase
MDRFISNRARGVRESGIRRIFHLAATLDNPIDFSIGQPDFDVPDRVKQAAIDAIQRGDNGYTVTLGLPSLREAILAQLADRYAEPPAVLVTCGVSGALLLTLMATVNDGDEVLYPDPYFVSYPNLVTWFGGRPVAVPSVPSFRLPIENIQNAITPASRVLLINSPNNPTGIVYSADEIRQVCDLAEKHDLLIVSDEIYSDLCYDESLPSPIDYAPHRTILLRGFGKSYGMTGWRMGFVAGPEVLVSQMANMQQYTFVCAPSIAQHATIEALNTDISAQRDAYRHKRDTVAAALEGHFEFTHPSGGFYFFLKAPQRYGTATAFVEAALEKNLLCVPGTVFSQQDTHFRISYAVDDDTIRQGCSVLTAMAK